VRAADLARAKRGGDYFRVGEVEDNPLLRALDRGHIRFCQLRRGEGRGRSIPNFTIVSFTQGGLTALMRKFRGISSAAARTKSNLRRGDR
jgi:hypothetical protein